MRRPQFRGPGLLVLSLLIAAFAVGAGWRAFADTGAPADARAATSARAVVRENAERVQFSLQAGWRAEQVAAALDRAGLADRDRFLELVRNPAQSDLLRSRWGALESLEGYLFPGDYEFPAGLSEEAMLQTFTRRFAEAFDSELRARADELGLSVHEVVTLASIVEREMVFPSEAPAIASVFHNRLELGMPLGSDPTVQYFVDTELGETNTGYWQREIRTSDLQRDTPYNTYVRVGLPPGPIASPGIDAINAVLNPPDFDYLFFYGKGDHTHAFAKTASEHEANIARYGDGSTEGPTPDGELQSLVERVMDPVRGRVGVVVENLATGERAAVNPDQFFTAASLYKLAVMWAAFSFRERGLLSFDELLQISPSAAARDNPERQRRLGTAPTVREAIEEMIVVSSNAAGVTLLNRIGREAVDGIMRNAGLRDTSVVSKRLVTTPEDVADLLEQIATGRAVSGTASAEMVGILLNQELNDRLPKYLPAEARLAHKTGTLDFPSHDAGILYTSAGPVVIAAMSEDVANTAEATESLAHLGRAVYGYFERYVPARERISSRRDHAACPTSPFEPSVRGDLSGRTIVLDPGHGGRRSGATRSALDGASLTEKDLALDVAFRLGELLAARGATVYMTRCKDATVSLMSRAAFANAAGADLVVSLHFHGARQESRQGTEVRYFGSDSGVLASHLLGTFAEPALWDTLTTDRPTVNVGLRPVWNDLLVFSSAPTVVTVPVSLSDPEEVEGLSISASIPGSRRDLIARGLLSGIRSYFGVRDEPSAGATQAAVQDSQAHGDLRTDVLARLDGAGARVALTFDDCNSREAWKRILDELETAEVEATFFCSGTMAISEPGLALRTVRDGHSVGSHGWDHTEQLGLPRPELRRRFDADTRAWQSLAQVSPAPYFRPPFGAYDRRTLSEAARAGFSRTVLWDVDSLDWTDRSVDEIVERVLRQAHEGSIVLMHVLPGTADALPLIIEGLRALELEPTDLDSLFEAHGDLSSGTGS